MAFPPEAYLIGAPKCGTTTLTDLLAHHPGVCLARPRDADFFTRNRERGYDWYRTLFQGDDHQVFLDVSLSYAQAPVQARSAPTHLDGVPGRIYAARPDARFLYVVRDPVARTYSMYWHNRRHGHESLALRDAIREDPAYLEVSDYAAQLQRYFEYFPQDSFKILIFERMTRDPVAAARECLAFLGVDPDAVALEFERPKNQGYQLNRAGRLLHSALGGSERFEAVVSGVKRLVPPPLRSLAAGAITADVPALGDADREWIAAQLGSAVADFEAVYGERVPEWHG